MSRDRFDGFEVVLFRDDEGDWVAHFAELPNISAFGSTPEKALRELGVAWTLVKDDYKQSGDKLPLAPSRRRYGGVFQVRIDKRVHRALAIEAERNGISLNALVAEKLARKLDF
jgi:predicted HicB family RNase H-like nuclease